MNTLEIKELSRTFFLDKIQPKEWKDKLSVKFVGEMPFSLNNGWKFVVVNETKQRIYTIEIFRSQMGDWLSRCNCPSREICKHLVLAKSLFEKIREGLEND